MPWYIFTGLKLLQIFQMLFQDPTLYAANVTHILDVFHVSAIKVMNKTKQYEDGMLSVPCCL
jgi:hypothetical protein